MYINVSTITLLYYICYEWKHLKNKICYTVADSGADFIKAFKHFS